ncbi:reverse transcriptase (RNA-dependent DNA polymerase) domain-containing protein [Hirsutella rhossiliensis]|uniref:Reverse transcriptase (RNA-dependent DNA polymerase) domain-containing protein n=1 Tax=Hirsutella rhossiliensis TaxID=111463 RepID=A0A9P8N4A1_9HYPO|nr:reverse transcriptase (RNA-dependent DNA polymerase) domain-containing protein [Hirsutella rhossiliensis]KAH0966580.1 reverse transcriptase (RNA-dependent DNA polymerase) domain-containing protein [Hirsutella rhossiliensis]
MGKKDYKGTILDGRDSFDSWKMDLEDNLLSDDLMSCVTGKATAESSDLSTPGENAADIKNVSLARMKIRQSIDQIHKNSVNHLTDPRAIYQSLVKRYATSNKARLRQLMRMLYDVSTQTNRTVQEKVDDLKRLRAQINSQDKDIVIHEQLLICFLQMSMDDAFNTTVEILNASTETLTMEKVQSSLESKELELVDTTIKGETAQFAGRGRSAWNKGNNRSKAQDGGDDSKEEYLKKAGGCWSCGVWVYFSRDKTRITDKIKAWVVVAEAECREYGKGEKVKAMRFDRGKEFLNEAMKKVHEVRFVEFDESKYMDNEISQESQSQYDDEKEEKKEQGELTDDDSDAEDSVRDRTMDQEATEAGEDAGEAADGNPTDQDTADSEEELQGDTIESAENKIPDSWFTQKHGINYEETFAPTIRLDAMRIILALAAKKGWKVYQMDAVAAFLAADLKERIFMKVPTELQQYFGKYVQILKRDWFLTDDSGPDNIQTYRVGVIIGVHVDDFMITGDEDAIELVKEKLKEDLR